MFCSLLKNHLFGEDASPDAISMLSVEEQVGNSDCPTMMSHWLSLCVFDPEINRKA